MNFITLRLLSILVVDDSAVDREIVSIACSCLDCEVETVESAEEALNAYKARRHSIVLTDYKMEPVNGLQLIAQIKQYDRTVAVANRMDQCIALLGQSYEICQVRKQLARIVNSHAPLVLEGPPGIGKPEIARFIHKVGPFSQSHLVECVCSDMTIEEMHRLVIDEAGNWGELLRESHNGTLVLFNIQNLTMPLQEALAREFQSLAGNCHVITIADGRLDAMLDAGQIEMNLYFQLSAEILHIPALSERPVDVEEIVRFIAVSPEYCDQRASISATEIDFLVAELRRARLDRNLRELIERVSGHCLSCLPA